MPWKLAVDEPTVSIEVKVPQSMKEWLQRQPRGVSATIRTMIARAMKRQKRGIVT